MNRTYMLRPRHSPGCYYASLAPPIAVANTVSGVHCPVGRAGGSRPRLLTPGRARTGDTSVAAGQCTPNRCAGFEAGTGSAGLFVVTDANRTEIVAATASSTDDNEITHHARIPFAGDGTVTVGFDLTNMQPGSHTLYVAAND